jgi:phosphate transport system substrate-binding protein
VALSYNLPELKPGQSIRLDGDTLAGIFLGTVKSWNDERLVKLNPDLALPDRPITVIARSDGSGTTAVFTDYLSRVSPAWKEKVGSGTSVRWPTGLGAKGNEGVTGQVKTTPGSIGYLELAYAVQNHLPYASLKNRSNAFVGPSLEGITAAAESALAAMPADYRVSIVDAPGLTAYPIAAYTYLLVYEELGDATKAAALARFLWWAVHDGQRFAADLHYGALPAPLVERLERTLRKMRSHQKPLLPAAGPEERMSPERGA